ncbi:uncharacterized protein LOC113855962 [Abrus precatorius]|uniref:Uncharacterized protein LOC113855962 n=1 Tax=Abrus precatorius TaxID=3816 RepID=A0A8B8KHZ0_ABRPR|nr:uncharacterized protein LOC113855962 [Abrus precatorius]
MKGIMDLFCSSIASTAVTSGMNNHSMVRRSTKRHPSVRRKSQLRVPYTCSSKLPINPKPYYSEKHRKSSAEKQNYNVRRKSSVQVNNNLYDSTASSASTHLLSDAPFIDWVSESDKIPAMATTHKPIPNQVVVLRVSLHCKACEGKVRKHISKMEGVTSFSIDMEAKKVTIIGHVTPLGVLASVSKVKNAQLWP